MVLILLEREEIPCENQPESLEAHSMGSVGWTAKKRIQGSNSHPKGSEGQPKMLEGRPKGFESQPKGSEGQLEGVMGPSESFRDLPIRSGG